jgi:hypothetical protein
MSTQSITSLALSRREAAKALGVGLSMFDSLEIPKIQIGRRVVYRREVLESWLKKQELKPGSAQKKGA